MAEESSHMYPDGYSLINMTWKTPSLMTLMKHCKHIFIPRTLGMMMLMLVKVMVMTDALLLMMMMTVTQEKVMTKFHYREIAHTHYVTVTQLKQDTQEVPGTVLTGMY